jgi:tetratricopeptide (TPR) repeat protein
MPLFGRKKNKEYQEAAKLLSQGETDTAIQKLRDIIKVYPDDTNSLTALGVALIQSLGDDKSDSLTIDEAMGYFDRAMQANPKDPVPLFNKGVCLRDIGRKQEALEVFDQVLQIKNRFPLAILHKAEINYELENYEEAVDLARLALIRDPGLASTMTWVKDAMDKAGLLDDDGNPIDKPPRKPRMF